MKVCAIIPCYNHYTALADICQRLLSMQLDIVIVDDASDETTQTVITELATHKNIHMIRHNSNQGKGGAVKTGLAHAHNQGFTHALQLDADGQHNLEDATKLLALAKQHPSSVISGQPIYDESIPAGRKYGRYITHFWVWLETLSFSIKDTMCGFRVYPLSPCITLLESKNLGNRMDFDIEILVRLYWQNVPTLFVPTAVIYHREGLSHFQPFADNVRISWLHTRLFFGMLIRLPKLVIRKVLS